MTTIARSILCLLALAGAGCATSPAIGSPASAASGAAAGKPTGAATDPVTGAATVAAPAQPAGDEGPMRYRRADGALVDCRYERPTGSNIAERICRTYLPRRAEDQKALDDVLLRSMEGTPRAGSAGR
jgi:hypothetical protein